MIKKILFIGLLTFGITGYSQTVVFSENFNEEATRNLWTLEDLDGDGQFWEFADAEFQEVENFEGWFAWSFSWYFEVFTPDNTLTSPVITLPSDENLELTFKVGAFEDDELFQEHYAVYVIPADATFVGTETPVFEETLDDDYYPEAKVVNVDISSFAGQDVKLVFRHYDVEEDIFYIGIDDVLIQTVEGASVNDFKNASIKVYPNPTSDVLNIQGVEDINRIRIFDLQGKIVQQANGQQINVQSLSNGTYIVNFYNETNVYSRKFVKN